MASQAEELAFETGQSGLDSPCGVTPPDPPAHVYQATAVATANVPPGTVLPVGVSTVGNTTTLTLPAVTGSAGSGGGASFATVLLPNHAFSGVIPNTGYQVAFTWDTTQGTFSPFAFVDGLANDRGAHFNPDSANKDTLHYGWSVTVPPATGGGYTPAPMNVWGAKLIGTWTPAAGVTPTAPGVYTITGNWAI